MGPPKTDSQEPADEACGTVVYGGKLLRDDSNSLSMASRKQSDHSMERATKFDARKGNTKLMHHPTAQFEDLDIINKSDAMRDIDKMLGNDGPPAVEYIFVEDVVANPFVRVGLGHACVRYTRKSDKGERVANVTRGRHLDHDKKEQSIVEMWESPADYLLGSHGGKGGIFSRNICSIRVEDHDEDALEAMHHYFHSLCASYKSKEAEKTVGFSLFGMLHNALAFLNPLGSQRQAGNCAQFTSQGLFLAGLLTHTHIFPKFIWADMFEHLVMDTRAKVVYYKQPSPAPSERQRPLARSVVSPFQLFRSWLYWDLERFADVVVTVDGIDGKERKAVVTKRNPSRPLVARGGATLVHATVVVGLAAYYVPHGWPQESDCSYAVALLARLFLVIALFVLNSMMY